MAEEKLFLRKATGLVREIGFATAIIIILCNVIGVGWQRRVFQASGWAPVKAGDYFAGIHPMVMSFLLVGILSLLTVWAVAVMSAAMPRSGGGYVFISRLVNPTVGFVAAWLAMLSTAVAYGQIGVFGAEVFQIFGPQVGLGLGPFDSTIGIAILGVVVILVFSSIGSLGVRLFGRFLQIIFVIPVAVLVIVYLLFLTASPDSITKGVQTLFGSSPAAYTQAAIAQGLDKNAVPYWSAVATATIASYWAYGGYYAASFVAGEIKEAGRNMPKILFTAGIIIVFVYMSISFLLNRAIGMAGVQGGWAFGDAVAFFRDGGGDVAKAGLPSVGAWMSFMAMIQAVGLGLEFLKIFIFLFALLWALNDIPPFLLTTSRTAFAMAFDRVMPEKLGEISERYHSPVNAVWFVSALALFGVVSESNLFSQNGIWLGQAFYTWLNPAQMVAATDIWGSIFEVFMGLACLLFPVRKPEIFERSPWKQSATVVQALGLVVLLGNLFLFWTVINDRRAWNFTATVADILAGKASIEALIPIMWTVVVILVGWGVYSYYSNKAKATGVSMTTIFTEIPPE